MSYGKGLSDFLKNLGISSMGSLTGVVNHIGLPDWLEITNHNPDAWDLGQMMLYKFFSPHVSDYITDPYTPDCKNKKIVLDVRREFNQNNDFFQGVYDWCSEHDVAPEDFVLLTGNLRAPEMLERFVTQSHSEGTVITDKINIYCDPYYFGYVNKYLTEFYDYPESESEVIHRRFKCYNNWSKPHRMCLYLQLKAQDLIAHNKVSYLNNDGYTVDNNSERFKEFMSDMADKIDRARDVLPMLCERYPEHSDFYHTHYSESDFPVRADDFDSKINHHIFYNYPEEWVDRSGLTPSQKALERTLSFPYDDVDFDIVTETVGDSSEWMALFVTEKTLKPMLLGIPVFVVAPRGTLSMIHDRYGTQSFSPWIDETYDTIPNMHLRIAHIVDQVDRIMNLSDSDYSEWLTNVRAIAHRNREHIIKNLQ